MSTVAADGVPALQAAVGTCEAATAFAKEEVASAVSEWWCQPAVDAVPWLKCKCTSHAQSNILQLTA